MTPREFEASMRERGESVLSIMLDVMVSGMKMQQEQADKAEGQPPVQFDLVKAFQNGEGRHLLRMTMGQQIEEVEKLAIGGKEGGTLLQGRNEKCLEVLGRELSAGKKKIGIYYGAAHFPHMERRLVDDLGFHKVGHEWIVAWDCKKRPDAKLDRALNKLRQQCRDELRALIDAARAHRMALRLEAPVTVAELAAAARDGKPVYTGPARDPWGHDYVLQKRPIGVRWQAVSGGQDGVVGTADDLVEIEKRRGGLVDLIR
jgi:hypothetical protein